jgi:hypothetical protein
VRRLSSQGGGTRLSAAAQEEREELRSVVLARDDLRNPRPSEGCHRCPPESAIHPRELRRSSHRARWCPVPAWTMEMKPSPSSRGHLSFQSPQYGIRLCNEDWLKMRPEYLEATFNPLNMGFASATTRAHFSPDHRTSFQSPQYGIRLCNRRRMRASRSRPRQLSIPSIWDSPLQQPVHISPLTTERAFNPLNMGFASATGEGSRRERSFQTHFQSPQYGIRLCNLLWRNFYAGLKSTFQSPQYGIRLCNR